MSRELTEPEILLRFLDGLKQAAASAHQLAHAQQNPQWLQVRDMLEGIRATGSVLATRRAMPRQDVLAALDRRQKSIVVN